MSVLEEGLGEETLWSRSNERIQAHYSSIMLHRKCPQAWYFRYGLGLRKPETGPAPYLHFGSWFGAMRAAETLVRGRRMGSLIQEPRKWAPIDGAPEFDMRTVTPAEVLQASVAWWKEQSQDEEVVAEWQSRLGEPLPQRLKGAFVRWRDEWAEEIKVERPLAIELFWKRNLPRPAVDASWDKVADQLPELYLIGFIDELYEDTQRGITVVRDIKTTSRMPTQSSLDDMLDSQLQLYAWGVTPDLQAKGLEIPRAISYDRILSTKPPTPKLNLNGTLSSTVRNFDLRTYREWAQKDTRPQSPEELLERCPKFEELDPDRQEAITSLPAGQVYGKLGEFTAKGSPKFGTYQLEDEVLHRLQQPDWRSMFHQRTRTPVNQQVIKAHLRAAVDTVTDIWRTQARAEVTFETARNLSKNGCQYCDFVNLCRAQIFGGADGQFDLREYGLKHKSGLPILERGEVHA